MNPSPPPFRIAIIGAGPIGKLLASSSTPHPRIALTQYESETPPRRPAFGYGIGPQTLRAAAAANPALGARLRATCILSRTWMRWWHGGAPDRLLADVRVPEGRVYGRCGRDELLALLEEPGVGGGEVEVQYGKTLVGVQRMESGELELRFLDGGRDVVHAIWACDGVNSLCRRVLQGADYQAPRYTRFLAFRGKVPAEKVAESLGPDFATESHCFVGVEGWHILTFPIGSGALTNIAAFAVEPVEKSVGRDHQLERDEMLAYFPGRNDKVDTLLQLMFTDTPGGPQRLALKDLGTLQPFTGERITVFGDAANAMTPHIAGSMSCGFIGAATFLEGWNARVRALAEDAPAEDVAAALAAAAEEYDAAHRPLAQKLLDLSAEQGPLWSGGVVDVEVLRERPSFLWECADGRFPGVEME